MWFHEEKADESNEIINSFAENSILIHLRNQYKMIQGGRLESPEMMFPWDDDHEKTGPALFQRGTTLIKAYYRLCVHFTQSNVIINVKNLKKWD